MKQSRNSRVFFSSASSNGWGSHIGYAESLYSGIRVDYVNPGLLEGFGLPPNLHFVGSLLGSAEGELMSYDSSWVEVSITPTPEPSTVLLSGWGLLVSGLAYLRRLRTRN